MKFATFLITEDVYPSIDDNDVLTTLDSLGIAYNRTKDGNKSFLYTFDNRYSLRYDGELFTLYRSENKIHMSNARNKSEINKSLETWTSSYELAQTEITDDDVEDIVNKMKADDTEQNTNDSEDELNKDSDDNNDDDFYKSLSKEEK